MANPELALLLKLGLVGVVVLFDLALGDFGFAGRAAAREGRENLPGFPSTMSSPPPFRDAKTVCSDASVDHPIVVNNAG